jgi:hypothetical protein
MIANVGTLDRALRLAVGLALIGFGLFDHSAWRWVGLVGVVLAATAVLRFCPAYGIFGLRTMPATRGRDV